VGNLPYTINDVVIRELFSGFGAIMSIDMPIDPAYVPPWRGGAALLPVNKPLVLG
jgi:RNA recognition motif-containing protein